jgi:glucose-6-phosphate dehydrogenase assembly protein OpcA
VSAPVRAEPRTTWSGEGVTVDVVAEHLRALQTALFWHEDHAISARSMNVVVAPSDEPGTEAEVARHSDALAADQPARTLVLEPHDEDRLDATIAISCSAPVESGPKLVHDRIDLRADRGRLAHADSLVRPLLVPGVPTVVWLPDASLDAVDATLTPLARHVVLDTARGEPAHAFERATHALRHAEVHDVAWGRLQWWRSRIGSSFDLPANLALLDGLDALEVEVTPAGRSAGLLLVGWIAARAGLEVRELEAQAGGFGGRAERRFGSGVAVTVTVRDDAAGAGGVERLAFRAGERSLELARGAATDAAGADFLDAVRPAHDFARGYAAALGAVVGAVAEVAA